MPSLSELLVQEGVCTKEQIDQAVASQVVLGGRLGTNLVELGFLTEATLAGYLSRCYGIPAMHGDALTPDAEVLNLISPQDAERLELIPAKREGNQLQCWCIDPMNLAALKELASLTGLQPQPVVVPESRLFGLLERYYNIERPLRYVVLNRSDFMGFSLHDVPPKDAQAPDRPVEKQTGFDLLYQRRDGFPNLQTPTVKPKVKAKVEAKPEIMQVSKPETKPETKPTSKLVSDPETKVLSKAEPKPASKVAMEPAAGHATRPAISPAVAPRPTQKPAAPKGTSADASKVKATSKKSEQKAPKAKPSLASEGKQDLTSVLTQAAQMKASEAQPPTPPSAPTLPVSARETPLSLQQATKLLKDPTDRDGIGLCLLRYSSSLYKRNLLFTVHRGLALGWQALGENIPREVFANLSIPLDQHSVFQLVANSRSHYLGALSRTEVNQHFLTAMGDENPLNAFVMPILVQNRLVNILYADDGHQRHSSREIGGLLILAQHAALAYEGLIRRQREQYRHNH